MSHDKLENVEASCVAEGSELPLLLRPANDAPDLAAWGAAHRETLLELLRHHGGLLFRDFDAGGVEGFEKFVAAVSGEPMGYQDRATPRSQVKGGVYTATDFPPEHSIFLHNESSFAKTWPGYISFHCVKAAEGGGETPIADVRRVFARLDPALRNRFIEKGVMYVRNFGDPFGLPWQDVFQTDDKAEMEAYCASAGITVEWKDEERLRTRQVRPAAARHPVTGELLWFNHATTLHISTVRPQLREMLQRMFADEDLPNNTYYGDGSPIEPGTLDALRAAYAAGTIAFPWEEGDVMLLDNMLAAHGRRPYTGAREVVAAMARPLTWDDVEAVTKETR